MVEGLDVFSEYSFLIEARYRGDYTKMSGMSSFKTAPGSKIPVLTGPNFIELLKQKILLNIFPEMSRTPVTNCICDMVVWLVTLFR